jgi:hypothetical protein
MSRPLRASKLIEANRSSPHCCYVVASISERSCGAVCGPAASTPWRVSKTEEGKANCQKSSQKDKTSTTKQHFCETLLQSHFISLHYIAPLKFSTYLSI